MGQVGARVVRRGITALLSLVVGLAACGPQEPASDASRASSATRAPDFSIDLVNGETFRLSEHLGKEVIVIDFFTTFCQPCVGALQHLQASYTKDQPQGLVVLAVAMDPPDTSGQIVPFVRSHKLTFPVAHDAQSRVTDLYNKKSLAPFQVLIGRDGRIIKQRESYQPGDEVGMEQDIQVALGNK
jgi:peroxiredoxin